MINSFLTSFFDDHDVDRLNPQKNVTSVTINPTWLIYLKFQIEGREEVLWKFENQKWYFETKKKHFIWEPIIIV